MRQFEVTLLEPDAWNRGRVESDPQLLSIIVTARDQQEVVRLWRSYYCEWDEITNTSPVHVRQLSAPASEPTAHDWDEMPQWCGQATGDDLDYSSELMTGQKGDED